MKQMPENSRRLLSFWLCLTTFAVFFLRHLLSFSSFLTTFAVFFLWHLRDDLVERSTARAKATRSVSLLNWKVQWTFHASSAASAYSASALAAFDHICRKIPGKCSYFLAARSLPPRSPRLPRPRSLPSRLPRSPRLPRSRPLPPCPRPRPRPLRFCCSGSGMLQPS